MSAARLKITLPITAAALALGLAAPSHAATWRGVVVAKDARRHTVVTASRSSLQTIRAPRNLASLRVGEVVQVDAGRLPDRTFRARRVLVVGRQRTVRFAGVVVRSGGGRLLVSGGGSIVGVSTAGFKPAAASDAGPLPGDKVVVTPTVSAGGLAAPPSGIQQIGHESMLVVQGAYAGASADGFDVAAGDAGLVHVVVPPSAELPAFVLGDPVAVVVTVDPDGRLIFLKGQVEHSV